jgi:hypothetical protein
MRAKRAYPPRSAGHPPYRAVAKTPRGPGPFDKHVVAPGRLAIHADRGLVLQQQPGEVAAGELAALIGVENLRPAVPGERFLTDG